MMNTNLYTAVGKFHVKGSIGSMRCPLVTIGGREFILDMQEMMLWTVLNWRILTEDEIYLLYEKKVQETGFMSARSAEECVRRLVQRGLIAKGSGDTGADALYDLLSELYVIPISENMILKIISFIRLTLFSRLPYSVTKKIFSKDKRNDSEKKSCGWQTGQSSQLRKSSNVSIKICCPSQQMKTCWMSYTTMNTPPATTLRMRYAPSHSAARSLPRLQTCTCANRLFL